MIVIVTAGNITGVFEKGHYYLVDNTTDIKTECKAKDIEQLWALVEGDMNN